MSIGVMAIYWMIVCCDGNYASNLYRCEKEARVFVTVTQWDVDHHSGIIPYKSTLDKLFSDYRKD
jgi:hypothetical protein